jgi:hypothetical protein
MPVSDQKLHHQVGYKTCFKKDNAIVVQQFHVVRGFCNLDAITQRQVQT